MRSWAWMKKGSTKRNLLVEDCLCTIHGESRDETSTNNGELNHWNLGEPTALLSQ